jgi:Phosphopantetheine attachment site.
MIDKKSIENKVMEIITSTIEDFSIQENNENCDLTLIGMDSMKFISIIVKLEEVFEIEFPDEYLVIEKMNTVYKIIDIVYSILTDETSNEISF